MTRLFIVPTPIGNLYDITKRALDVLKEAQLIICENILHSKVLLDHYDISQASMFAYSDKSEDLKGASKAVSKMLKYDKVCLISDAGTPLISDPGFKLVREAIKQGVELEVLPGATAFVPALVLSGLASNHFVFLGFLPISAEKRLNEIKNLSSYAKTTIIYEAPNRVLALLDEIKAIHGNINIAVCKELSKLHQNVYRGSIDEVYQVLENNPLKGEFVIVVEAIEPKPKSEKDLLELYKMLASLPTKDIVYLLQHNERYLSRKEAYRIALLLKDL